MLKGIEKHKRDRFSMGMDILRVLSEVEGKMPRTNVLYRANLTWKIQEDILGKLLKAGWISQVYLGKRTWCSITPAGLDVITIYKGLRIKFDGLLQERKKE